MKKDKSKTSFRPPRQAMIMLVCGETGVGKTFRNRFEIRKYLKAAPKSGKKARKVLAFDTNDDDYPQFRTIGPHQLKALKGISARRIRPFNPDGSPMNNADKRGVIEAILKDFRNGLLVLDDIDHYMTGARGQSMIGALCTVRHMGIDIILTHQSVAKITTTEWQNCTWLRLHHQVDDITRYRERIPRYRLVRIAQLIVDANYHAATLSYEAGQIDADEYRKRKGFFVYVNMRTGKLQGCSYDLFIRAALSYTVQEEPRKISQMIKETDFSGKPRYASREEALLKLLVQYARLWKK